MRPHSFTGLRMSLLLATVAWMAANACGEARESDDVGDRGGAGAPKGGSGGAGGKSTTGGQAGKTGGAVTGGATAGGSGSTAGASGGMQSMGGKPASGGEDGNMGGAASSLPSEGLVGWWSFEEGDGTLVKDLSGNGNDGVVVEGLSGDAPDAKMPVRRAGAVGKALVLDGLDDWVRVPDSDSIDQTGVNNTVSVSAWVKFDQVTQDAATSPYNFLLNRHEVGTAYEHFGLAVFEGRPTAAVHFFFASGPNSVPTGQWVHLAMTYDGITQRVYMNGDEAAFLDIGWPMAPDETPLTIGAGENTGVMKEFVSGAIDEVRLYDRELTAEEVKALSMQM